MVYPVPKQNLCVQSASVLKYNCELGSYLSQHPSSQVSYLKYLEYGYSACNKLPNNICVL